MVNFEAQLRNETGKGPSKRYRRKGLIPSIIYGQGTNTNILIESNSFNKIASKITKSTVINLKVESKNYEVFIKDFQKDYMIDKFLHVDFYELKKGKPVHCSIPFNLVGNPVGLREGGILEKHLVQVEIECLPKDVVASIDVDISGLNINQTIHVSDIKFDDKHKVLTNLEEVIVHMSGKSKGEEATATESEEETATEE